MIIPENSPAITVSGRTFAFVAVSESSFLGVAYRFGLFEESASSEWMASYDPEIWMDGSLTPHISTVGGIAAFTTALVAEINTWLTAQNLPTQFSYTYTFSSEPTTDASALTMVQSALDSGSFSGQALPQAMLDALKVYWGYIGALPRSYEYPQGTLTQVAQHAAVWVDNSGDVIGLTPSSDVRAIARKNTSLAALWRAAFGL